MINYHLELVGALEGVLPGKVYYEMTLHSGIATPCISYMEKNNYVSESGDTLGYSVLSYQVKVWSNQVADLQHYSLKIDDALRALGFKRVSSAELYDNQSSMIQKILTYEALALENYLAK